MSTTTPSIELEVKLRKKIRRLKNALAMYDTSEPLDCMDCDGIAHRDFKCCVDCIFNRLSRSDRWEIERDNP